MTAIFDRLALPVRKWIRAQGWRELRDIQVRTAHVLLDIEADLIVAAGTASGKTEAAFLPLISQILDRPLDGPGFDILYIAPLKALITDQACRLEGICECAGLAVTPWHGDVAASTKRKALARPRGILLITPESLEALFVRRGLDIPRLFCTTRAIVIDELHNFLDSERGIQMRSLLTRLDLAVKRQIRRIGLSATLGNVDLAKATLRPGSADAVRVVEAQGGTCEIHLQLRGYVAGGEEGENCSTSDAIARHIFQHLRGRDNLVFAGSRRAVEVFGDRLRTLCEKQRLPQEFYPHHANLSRDHREFVERRLKAAHLPTTAISTSTLELGIDIGEVASIAQIGAPFSVSSLRQRLGRSGRRQGAPAVLRQYAVEGDLSQHSHIADRLRLGLVRAVAMVELLLEGWCEPCQTRSLHLSTLVHQILSIIAERGGIHPQDAFEILCKYGPFRNVDSAMFGDVLRAMGCSDNDLIVQDSAGMLLLGSAGEGLVEHHSFFAAFKAQREYRLVANGKELGALPLASVVAPGMHLIFCAQRWRVIEVLDRERVIRVVPARAGVAPMFGGDVGQIDDVVAERMIAILETDHQPIYLDQTALSLLAEARANYSLLSFNPGHVAWLGHDHCVIATHAGTVRTATLGLALRASGFAVLLHDGFVEVFGNDRTPPVVETLSALAAGSEVDLFRHRPNLICEKFHPHLTFALLQSDALSSRFDVGALANMCRRILGRGDMS